MPIFKLCLKIFRKNWSAIGVFLVIFVSLSCIFAFSYSQSSLSKGFTQERAKVALISKEKTPLTEGFRKALAKNADFVTLPDQTEKMQDALFFRKATYILVIPKGFTKDALNKGTMKMEKRVVPGSAENAYIDSIVRQYWHLAAVYAQHEPNLSETQIADHVKHDLATSTPVAMHDQHVASADSNFITGYFNFVAYGLTIVMIVGIAAVFIVMNSQDINRRIICSPIHSISINLQIFLAIIIFALFCWAGFSGLGIILNFKNQVTAPIGYYLLNSIVFTLCLSSISYLIGNLVSNRQALSAIANVIGLGSAFLSGAFVPQELMNHTVLKIASFTPTYWYVTANNRIAGLGAGNWAETKSIINDMAIVLAFAVAFLILALVIGKRRRMYA